MTENEKSGSKGMDWLGIVSFGIFILLLGTIWIITPNLTQEVRTFFNPENWHLKNVTEHIAFPEPERSYPIIYTAAIQFCFTFAAFHIIILALRFVLHDTLERLGETFSGMVFWLGAGFFVNLLTNKDISWFGFLAGLMISVGLSIIVRGIVGLFKKG